MTKHTKMEPIILSMMGPQLHVVRETPADVMGCFFFIIIFLKKALSVFFFRTLKLDVSGELNLFGLGSFACPWGPQANGKPTNQGLHFSGSDVINLSKMY